VVPSKEHGPSKGMYVGERALQRATQRARSGVRVKFKVHLAF
jgi:hypothetical protein